MATYTHIDFFAFYPQFNGNISASIVDQFCNLALATVDQSRWHDTWFLGMATFVAHFCTLYLETLAGSSPTASQVVGAAQARGLLASEAAGDVSVSYDFASITDDLGGWAMYKSTSYGLQFATLAKTIYPRVINVW